MREKLTSVATCLAGKRRPHCCNGMGQACAEFQSAGKAMLDAEPRDDNQCHYAFQRLHMHGFRGTPRGCKCIPTRHPHMMLFGVKRQPRSW